MAEVQVTIQNTRVHRLDDRIIEITLLDYTYSHICSECFCVPSILFDRKCSQTQATHTAFSRLIVMSIWCLNGYHFCFESSSSFFLLRLIRINRCSIFFWVCLIVHLFTNRLKFWILAATDAAKTMAIRSRIWYVLRSFSYSTLATYLLKCEKIHDWTSAHGESMKLKTLFVLFVFLFLDLLQWKFFYL